MSGVFTNNLNQSNYSRFCPSFSDSEYYDKTPPEKFRKRQLTSAGAGMEVSYGFNEHIGLLAGVNHYSLGHGYRFHKLVFDTFPDGSTRVGGSSLAGVRFSPIHFNLSLQVRSGKIGKRLYLHQQTGFVYMPKDPASPSYGIDEAQGIENYFLTYQMTSLSKRNYCLRTGAGMDILLPNGSFITAELIYNVGFNYIERMDLQYSFMGDPHKATIRSKADYATLQIGYKMPVNKLPLLRKKNRE